MNGIRNETGSTPGGNRLLIAAIMTVLVLYWGTLFYMTHVSIPADLLPGDWDKVIHFCSYAVLGMLLISLRAARGPYSWLSVISRCCVVATYGIIDETTQMLVNRTADVKDWLADATGGIFGVALVTLIVWNLQKNTAAPEASAPIA